MPAGLQARGWWLAQLAGFMGRSAELGSSCWLNLQALWAAVLSGVPEGWWRAQGCDGADLVGRGPVCSVWGRLRKNPAGPLAAGASWFAAESTERWVRLVTVDVTERASPVSSPCVRYVGHCVLATSLPPSALALKV